MGVNLCSLIFYMKACLDGRQTKEHYHLFTERVTVFLDVRNYRCNS